MTGTFPDAIKTDLATVSGTAGPQTDKTNLVAAQAPAPDAAAGAGGGQWAIPYDQQVGNTKYAPMQPIPPKEITATNTKPLWPTSGVTIATTFLPTPNIATTLTQSNTFVVTMHPNTVRISYMPYYCVKH